MSGGTILPSRPEPASQGMFVHLTTCDDLDAIAQRLALLRLAAASTLTAALRAEIDSVIGEIVVAAASLRIGATR